VALYTWLLDKYAQQGWKILDTHLGSGSSAIAAHDMGFEFHGYELDEEYFEAASKRLKLHQQQMKLF
jgi:site-specific DNA-methyltransferase (adenine-specific)